MNILRSSRWLHKILFGMPLHYAYLSRLARDLATRNERLNRLGGEAAGGHIFRSYFDPHRRERVTIVDANDTRGDGLDVGH